MGSRVWIPVEHRVPGAIWIDVDGDDCIQGYVNDDNFVEGSVCRACGSKALMMTEVVTSSKTLVSEFCDQYGLEDVSFYMSGARQGDVICTCLSCGEVEEGSAPFGMLVPQSFGGVRPAVGEGYSDPCIDDDIHSGTRSAGDY